MTTHNTHHEHSDVDTSVVEHTSVLETTVVSIPSETSLSTASEEGINTSTSEFASTTSAQVETDQQIPTIHSLAAMEEEVRPFTDFIVEFRQAEARLNASVEESQSEVFTIRTTTEEQQQSQNAALAANDLTVAPLFEQGSETVEQAQSQEPKQPIDTHSTAEQVRSEEIKEEAIVASKPAASERAVSPLLRPASRLRPRHSGTRHIQRDMPIAEADVQTSKPEAEQPVPASTTTESPEPIAEPEKPQPARRYRFDRPAASSGVTTPVQRKTTESSPVSGRHSGSLPSSDRADSGHMSSEQKTEIPTQPMIHPVGGVLSAEPTSEQVVAQQAESSEYASVQSPVQEHGRRRQGHVRTKEQTVAASPASTPPLEVPAVVAATQPEEIAPEDLPPLEYAELQKANSRRRRRHRPGSSNGTAPVAPLAKVALTTPNLPIANTRPAAIQPVSPATSASQTSGQYTLISGYTVNQMNQGNEVTGPFMGPEPSPARGSVMTRDRYIGRTEAVRTPSPMYPARTTQESGVSAATLNQFANVISQAIQTQTDRMATELRRAVQAPTNVSVSLPPFPSTERVGVFVDVANLLYSARTLRMAVDFGKLLDFLRGNRRLVRAQAYCPTSPQASDEQMFLQAVKGLGYRITTKNYKTFSSGAKKADLDLDLCMDVVRLVDGSGVDCVVLVSGDSDFMPMLDYCYDHGVRVEVAAFDEAMSATLRQGCDLFINLSMLEEIRV